MLKNYCITAWRSLVRNKIYSLFNVLGLSLLPGNRYDEARGSRKSAYQGSYKVTDNHIDYKDDTGFTADGEFRNGILYHAGMVLYKENKM